MTEQTAAQQQADVLTALAEHLRANPELSVVHDVHRSGPRWAFQVMTDLPRWARSIGVTDLHVARLPYSSKRNVTAQGVLGGIEVLVCSIVEDLDLAPDKSSLTVAELEHLTTGGAS